MATNLPHCHVEGAKHSKLSMSPSQMCGWFRSQLAKEIGPDTDLSGVRIVLRAVSVHEFEASMTKVADEQAFFLPPMTVKVLDRPINSSDIKGLASAVGQALIYQKR